MHPSCLKTAFAFLLAAATAVRADIPPDADEHVVARTFGVANADADPGKAIIACEFHPGSAAPVVAYRLHDATRSGLLYYKFDRVKLFWAKASDWPALHSDGGIHDGPPSGPVGKNPGADWQAQGEGGDWKVGGALLTRIDGDVQAGGTIVKNTDPLASEEWVYAVTGLDKGGTAELASKTSLFSDGRKPETKQFPLTTGIDDLTPNKSGAGAAFSADRRELRLTTAQGGVAAIVLYGAGGKRLWTSRRVLAAGQAHRIDLPRLAPGAYFLSVRGIGWGGAFPLHH